MIKDQLKKLIHDTVAVIYPDAEFSVELEKPSNPKFGDFATNVAMTLAKPLKKNPREIAQAIEKKISGAEDFLESVSIAGPGFINFKIKPQQWIQSLEAISKLKENYGKNKTGEGKKVVVEFVSANPTGPLHIGNARGGPLGDSIASLLEAQGYEVVREFYLNDVGGQIRKLGESMLFYIEGGLRETEDGGFEIAIPSKESVIVFKKSGEKVELKASYEGDYVMKLACDAKYHFGDQLNDKDVDEKIDLLGKFGVSELTEDIKKDCDDMGIKFDSWIHEKDILEKGETKKVLNDLKAKKVTVEKEGATWFAPQDNLLEDRECVLIKSDGNPTYFSNDIAYHVEKYNRGFDRLINIWGSNHHGHVPRVKAAVKSLGYDPEKIETVLYQYVRVVRGKEAVKMSKRAGDFVTARDILDEAGKDALRFFLLMRAPESHLDFDLELAKKHSSENPVYYVQYAHARICSIFSKAKEAGISAPDKFDEKFVSLLVLPEEVELAKYLLEYPCLIQEAAAHLDPHRVSYYLLDLARKFQHYYDRARRDNRYRVITDDVNASQAKLFFIGCFRQILRNGLKILGVSAPEKM